MAAICVAVFHYLSGPAEKLPFLDRALHLLELTPVSLDTFFILSGFLIGGILLRMRSLPEYYKPFYTRRFLRIMPLYYAWIALFCVLYFVAPGWGIARPEGYSTAFYLASPIFLFQSFIPAIAVSAYMLVPTWTLVAEEYFYLVIPVCIRRMSSRRLVQFLLLVMVLAPVFRAVLFKYLNVRHGWAELSVYMWPPCRADALALGVLLAVIWQDSDLRARLRTYSRTACWGMFVFSGIAVFLQWMADRNFHHSRSLNAGLGRTAVEFACLCLIAYLVSDPFSRFARFLSTNTMRQFGKISYCLYIIHWGVLWMIFRFILHVRIGELLWLDFAVAPVALLVSIGISSLSWKYVESPLLHWGRKAPPKVAVPALSPSEPQAVYLTSR